jgi:hypothetical protein
MTLYNRLCLSLATGMAVAMTSGVSRFKPHKTRTLR